MTSDDREAWSLEFGSWIRRYLPRCLLGTRGVKASAFSRLY